MQAGNEKGNVVELRIFGGELGEIQWGDLGKLVKAPRQTLLISTSDAKFTIQGYRAESLVRAGVAEYDSGRQVLTPTERGMNLVSAHGLDGR